MVHSGVENGRRTAAGRLQERRGIFSTSVWQANERTRGTCGYDDAGERTAQPQMLLVDAAALYARTCSPPPPMLECCWNFQCIGILTDPAAAASDCRVPTAAAAVGGCGGTRQSSSTARRRRRRRPIHRRHRRAPPPRRRQPKFGMRTRVRD